MKKTMILLTTMSMLTACSNMPQLFWANDEGTKPDYASGSSSESAAERRVPLDVPPELRAELENPESESAETTANASPVSTQYRKTVAGKAVALHARLYEVPSSALFSAAVDAMTSLNLPVDSVDSPSGIITTDWVKKMQGGADGLLGSLGSAFGASSPQGYRYRYVVRVFKIDADLQAKSRLEIRMISQAYLNRHWINKPIKNKPSLELFSAVEKQLGLTQSAIENRSE